jgi:predicted  nucleic acid-binding Zn-ribbon protein
MISCSYASNYDIERLEDEIKELKNEVSNLESYVSDLEWKIDELENKRNNRIVTPDWIEDNETGGSDIIKRLVEKSDKEVIDNATSNTNDNMPDFVKRLREAAAKTELPDTEQKR